jgi:hypothetical protein
MTIAITFKELHGIHLVNLWLHKVVTGDKLALYCGWSGADEYVKTNDPVLVFLLTTDRFTSTRLRRTRPKQPPLVW